MVELYLQSFSPHPALEQIAGLAQKSRIPVQQISKPALEKLSGSPHHQGAVLKSSRFVYTPFEEVYAHFQDAPQGILLLLDQIQDPQNLGALLRSAECAGVSGVVLPEHQAAEVTPAVVKASAGASEWLSVCKVTNLARTIEALKEIPAWIYGADAQGSLQYHREKYPAKVALVMGSEGRGLRDLVRKKCDLLVSIPLHGKITSLNVSVATAVLLFEIARQQKA